MSEQERLDLRIKINKGLQVAYKNLLQRKAAMGQDLVFADENGKPRIVSAREALAQYEKMHKN